MCLLYIISKPHVAHDSFLSSSRIITLFVLQLSMTLFVLLGLSVLRNDAGRLVLGPLRRMLKIVAFCEWKQMFMPI